MRFLLSLLLATTSFIATSSEWPPYASEAKVHFNQNVNLLNALAREIRKDDYIQVQLSGLVDEDVRARKSFDNVLKDVSANDYGRYHKHFSEEAGIREIILTNGVARVYMSGGLREIDDHHYRWAYVQPTVKADMKPCPKQVEGRCGKCSLVMDNDWHVEYEWFQINENFEAMCD